MGDVREYFFVGIGSILLFRVIEHLLGKYIVEYSLFFLIFGIFILFSTARVIEKIPFLSKGVVRVTAMVFMFIGVGPYVQDYMPRYWYVFAAVAIGLITFGKQLGELIRNGIF